MKPTKKQMEERFIKETGLLRNRLMELEIELGKYRDSTSDSRRENLTLSNHISELERQLDNFHYIKGRYDTLERVIDKLLPLNIPNEHTSTD